MLQLVKQDKEPFLAASGNDVEQAEPASFQGRLLSPQVAQSFLRIAYLAEKPVDKGIVYRALPDQHGRRNQHPFLAKMTGKAHGARILAAHIGMVGAVGNIKEGTTVRIMHSPHQGDVRQMAAPAEGIVDNKDVAGGEGVAAKGMGHGAGHGAEMNRDVGGLGDQVAVSVENGAGEILAFLDVGGKRRAGEDDSHLFGNRGKQFVADLDLDGIHGVAVPSGATARRI